MNKYIFFDLDETLLHTRFHREGDVIPFRPIVRDFGDDGNKPVLYASYARPGAHELIAAVRAFIPEDRIFVLTTSTADYAAWNNTSHGFNFKPEHVISREHLHGKKKVEKLNFPEGIVPRAYLIDNLHRVDLGSKLSLLHRGLGFPIDQLYTYRITEYYGPAHLAEPPNPLFGGISLEEREDIVAFIQGIGTTVETQGVNRASW